MVFTPTEHRRLAAIMFTDMVGYSALSQENEHLALELLEEHRTLLRAAFARHGGREIETIGDGFFIEFPSALDGARCAVDIQQALTSRNISVQPERRILVRIGLHLGDVVYRGPHVHGDGVNIAARIEPLAKPGQICISEDVARQIQNKIDLPVRKLGKGELKNIRLPVDIYSLVLPGAEPHHPLSQRLAFGWRRRGTRRTAMALIAVGAITAATGTWVYLWPRRREEVARAPVGRERIAVLPFTNISANPNDEYFADGMTEELISHLSKIGGLRVIARTSVMPYKGMGKTVAEIGDELNVGSVLEGSIRTAERQLRITAQLIDVQSQEHLWSQDYDRKLTDVFSIQADIAEKVADALQIQLLAAEKQRLEQGSTTNVDAYRLYLQGLYQWNKQTKEGIEKSIEYYKQAIAQDPGYTAAHAWLAFAYEQLGWFGISPEKESFAKAKVAAAKAVDLDSANFHALVALADMQVVEWDWSGAERSYKRALSLNPSFALAHDYYGMLYLAATGRHDEAIAEVQRAVELDPLSVLYHHDLGWAICLARRYDAAIEQFHKVLKMEASQNNAYRGLGELYAYKGWYDQSIDAMKNCVKFTDESPYALASLGWAYGVAGRHDQALKVLDTLNDKAKREPVAASDFARVYLGLGKKDAAIDWLNRTYEERSGVWILVWAKEFPFFDSLRKEAGFNKLLKRLRLL
jgi:adenylate cyclase